MCHWYKEFIAKIALLNSASEDVSFKFNLLLGDVLVGVTTSL